MKVLVIFCVVVAVFGGYLVMDMVHGAEHAGDAYDSLVARYSR